MNCLCGCGQQTKKNNRYIHGHSLKIFSKEYRIKNDKKGFGLYNLNVRRTWNKGLTKDNPLVAWNLRNFRHKKGDPYLGKLTEKGRKNLSESSRKYHKGRKHTEETKRKMSFSHLGKKQPMSEQGKMNISKNHYPGFTGIQWQKWVRRHPESLGKISMPQKLLYFSIKEIFLDTELEYPLKCNNTTKFLDIYIPSLKINIEYDGIHWHDIEKDVKRDELLRQFGIIVIRLNKNTYMDIVRNPKIIFDDLYQKFIDNKKSDVV